MKKFLSVLLVALLFIGPAPFIKQANGSVVLVAEVCAGSAAGGAITTAGVDTSGADGLIAAFPWYDTGGTTTGTISDSKGNTWVTLSGASSLETADLHLQIAYVQNPTVGAAHTFSVSATGGNTYPSVCVKAFSGTNTSDIFDTETGDVSINVTSNQPGSITTASGNLLVTAKTVLTGNGVSPMIDSSFVFDDDADDSVDHSASNHFSLRFAHKISTGAAENPTWSYTGNDDVATNMASFNMASAGGNSQYYRQQVAQ